MNNDHLDIRIRDLAIQTKKLCDEIKREEPEIEHAVALGALLASYTILRALSEDTIMSIDLVFPPEIA